MPSSSEAKKRSALSRFVSVFKRRSRERDPPGVNTSSTQLASRSSAHPSSLHSDPGSSLPISNSTPQDEQSKFPTHQRTSGIDATGATSLPTVPTYPCTDNLASVATSTSFFSGANGIQTGDIQYFEASHVTVNTNVGVDSDKSNSGSWDLLLRHTAPNALYNSSARYDAPKCDEDTRVEVISEIMNWIQDRDPTHRLLCMTGAAGSGKSALQQTIAERCTERYIPSATFFLSSTDPTRNNVSSIVPTIAYQLGLKHALVRASTVAAVKRDPLVFSQSLRSQMDTLIVRPFEEFRRSSQLSINASPYVIFIDGLDECNGYQNTSSDPARADNNGRRQAEDRQAELLAAIKHCILDNDLPIRVFIASRPEWAIRTALEPGGYLHRSAYHIRLSDEYDASGDMRRYLQRRFGAIGVRIGNPQWFAEDEIEALVGAASGQFIYVATVFSYVSQRRGSPSQRLSTVLGWVSTPNMGRTTRPFEALDKLYTKILLEAKNAYEAVDTHHGRDFLLLLRAQHLNVQGFHDLSKSATQFFLRFPADILAKLLSLESGAPEDLENLLLDLHSLMTLEIGRLDYGDWTRETIEFLRSRLKGPESMPSQSERLDEPEDLDKALQSLGIVPRHHQRLRLYHKSFSDFLEDESRANDLFVPRSRVEAHLARCCMQQIMECPPLPDAVPVTWDELPFPKPLMHSLRLSTYGLISFLRLGVVVEDKTTDLTAGWRKLSKMLFLVYSSLRDQFPYPEHSRSWIRQIEMTEAIQKCRTPETRALIDELVREWCVESDEADMFKEFPGYEEQLTVALDYDGIFSTGLQWGFSSSPDSCPQQLLENLKRLKSNSPPRSRAGSGRPTSATQET